MKKMLRLSLAGAAIAAAGSAHALSFQTVANASFSEYFYVTPDNTNSLALLVSGLEAQFQSLNFSIGSVGLNVGSMSFGGNLLAVFNDPANNAFTLQGNTPYLLHIEGFTKASPPGGNGLVSISAINAEVSPVPESDAYAMLLAVGFGLRHGADGDTDHHVVEILVAGGIVEEDQAAFPVLRQDQTGADVAVVEGGAGALRLEEVAERPRLHRIEGKRRPERVRTGLQLLSIDQVADDEGAEQVLVGSLATDEGVGHVGRAAEVQRAAVLHVRRIVGRCVEAAPPGRIEGSLYADERGIGATCEGQFRGGGAGAGRQQCATGADNRGKAG